MARRELQCHWRRKEAMQRGVCESGRKGKKNGVYGGQCGERRRPTGGEEEKRAVVIRRRRGKMNG